MGKIIIIGGGAAGFFAAMTCASHYPQHQVSILEKTSKLLAKVKISGGGRCNVTHACYEAKKLIKFYPRGEKALRQAFKQFMPQDIQAWLKARKVSLKTENDGRIFPISDDSQTIIDCFFAECQRLNIKIQTRSEVKEIIPQEAGGFYLKLSRGESIFADRVIIASGGSPKHNGLDWLAKLGHQIVSPVPSLFTFNMPDESIKQLMGVAIEPVQVKIIGTKLKQSGSLLITHWGMSGPVVLKLSAWGARVLEALKYEFTIQVNWKNGAKEDALRLQILDLKQNLKQKKIKNYSLDLPKRLWHFLLDKAKIQGEKTWQDLSKNDLNRLLAILTNDAYQVKGKTTFKEEFVTCGGVHLNDIDIITMQSRQVPHLFFAGEVLDIDGVTGGFNFQAAWTTSFIAGISAGKDL